MFLIPENHSSCSCWVCGYGTWGDLLSVSVVTCARLRTSPRWCVSRRHVHVSLIHCASFGNLHISRRENSQLTLQAWNSLNEMCSRQSQQYSCININKCFQKERKQKTKQKAFKIYITALCLIHQLHINHIRTTVWEQGSDMWGINNTWHSQSSCLHVGGVLFTSSVNLCAITLGADSLFLFIYFFKHILK